MITNEKVSAEKDPKKGEVEKRNIEEEVGVHRRIRLVVGLLLKAIG